MRTAPPRRLPALLGILAATWIPWLVCCATGDVAGPEQKPSPGVLTLEAPASAEADGATQVRLVTVVDSMLPRDQRTVTFRTSAGTFSGGGRELAVPSDNDRKAIAVLIAPRDSMTAEVTATAGAKTLRAQVRFVVAPPDQMTLTTDQLYVAAGFTKVLQVTATLRRSPGTPTPGQIVTFEAHAEGDTVSLRGRFSPDAAPSDTSGRVIVRFSPADTDSTGTLVIRGTAMGRGSSIRASTKVQVVRDTAS